MTIKFSGQIKSKGVPPKWFKVASWIRRMFVWDESYPVSFVYNTNDQEFSKGYSPFGIPFVFSFSDRGDSVRVSVTAMGLPLFDENFDVHETWNIKAGYAGQRVEGLFEVSD